MFVDSHCHLNYLEQPQQALDRALEQQVQAVLCIGVNAASFPQVLALANQHSCIWATAGQHPESANEPWDWIAPQLNHPRVVAVGETGLDYHQVTDPELRLLQRQSFAAQLELARTLDFPVVVHTRSAQADTLALLRDFPGVRGVLHCFTESWEMAEAALEMGFYISISGIVTFNNGSNVRDVAARIPMDRLLIETDSPWLAPVPHRGKTNEPAYVVEVAKRVAVERTLDLEVVAASTRQNFFSLFSRAVAD